MIAVEILPVALPDSADSPDARDFLDYVALAGMVTSEQTGAGALAQHPSEALARMRDGSGASVALLARIAGRAAGAARLVAPDDGSVRASISVFVPRRNAGILETMLIKAVETEARARWRVAIRAVSLHRPDPDGDAIPTASGDGSVPRDPQARALAESGYTLHHVERHATAESTAEHLAAEWLKTLAA